METLWPGLTAPGRYDDKGWKKLASALLRRRQQRKEIAERQARDEFNRGLQYRIVNPLSRPVKPEQCRPAKRRAQKRQREFWDSLTK